MSHAPGTPRRTPIARNVALSMAGQVLPMLVALVAIPRLIAGLGTDRFGVLTLGWSLVGYFALFDLGIGWAVTRLVSTRLSEGRPASIPALAWTSMIASFGLGLLGAALLAALVPWLVTAGLRVPPDLTGEAARAFLVLAASLPFVTVLAGIAGVLAGYQRFDLVQAVRGPMLAAIFLVPLLAMRGGLVPVFASLAAVRVAAALIQLLLAVRAGAGLSGTPVFSRADLGALLRFGGWVSVSNAIGPILVSFDRFVIGAMLSMTAVAHYAAPYEVATRFLVLAVPVGSVLFPAFAASHGRDAGTQARLFRRGVATIVALLLPCMAALAILAPEIIRLWLGPDFVAGSTPVLRWLAIGVLINGLAQVPFFLVHGAGRPDLVARLHLLEVPVYLATLAALIRWRGIEGAAIAWTLRVTVDAAVLFVLARGLLRRGAAAAGPREGAGVRLSG
jgi:O-antigen/teichoic acid export membrane protein